MTEEAGEGGGREEREKGGEGQEEGKEGRRKRRKWRKSYLVAGVLSPVNPKKLYQGRKQTSIHLLVEEEEEEEYLKAGRLCCKRIEDDKGKK